MKLQTFPRQDFLRLAQDGQRRTLPEIRAALNLPDSINLSQTLVNLQFSLAANRASIRLKCEVIEGRGHARVWWAERKISVSNR